MQVAATKLIEGKSLSSSSSSSQQRPSLQRVLTPMDANTLQLCLSAGNYPMAKRHLVGLAGLVEVAPKSTGLTALDFLRFHYYAGLVWGGLKAWPEAVESFKLAVTMPSEAVSTVSVEAYKKLVLSSLICKGKKPVLPPYTATPVVRCLKLAARVYDNLAARFEEDDPAGLEAEVAKEFELLEKDKNVGLAKQVRATPHVYFLPCFVGCLVLSNLGGGSCSGPNMSLCYVFTMFNFLFHR